MTAVEKSLPPAASATVPAPPPTTGRPGRRAPAEDCDVLRSLEQLVDAVLAGTAVVPTGEGGVVVDVEMGGFRWIAVQQRPVEVTLSPRESEIARMVACGLTNKAIASVLDISPWTVGTYLRRIFVKLDVNSRAAMTAAVSRLLSVHLEPDRSHWSADE